MSENEKNEILNGHTMSEEEMKVVAGGVHIDWPAKCNATVEDGSSCVVNDACYGAEQHYWRDRSKHGCSATVASTSWCSSNDYCTACQIKYDACSSNFGEDCVE